MKKRRGLTKKERRNKKKLQLKNKKLVKKYYWLVPRNVWSGKILDNYDYTWIDWGWSPGWDKTFGQMYMDELGAAIEKSGQKNFMILQIKEKFGQARLYCGGASEEVHRIIDKYECISEHVCYYCGIEAPMVGTNWILPQCFDCYCKYYRRTEKWFLEHHPEQQPKTTEELRQKYDELIMDEPDENGEYHIPYSYTITRYSKGDKEDITYDISDTVKKIQKRISKYKRSE